MIYLWSSRNFVLLCRGNAYSTTDYATLVHTYSQYIYIYISYIISFSGPHSQITIHLHHFPSLPGLGFTPNPPSLSSPIYIICLHTCNRLIKSNPNSFLLNSGFVLINRSEDLGINNDSLC